MSEGFDHLRLLCLGAPKIGKTTTCIATAPEGGVYVINSDQLGATKPARAKRTFDEGFAEGPEDFELCLSAAKKGVKEGRYQTIVWDTVTEYGRKTQYRCEDEDKDGRKAWFRLSRFVMQGVDRLLKLPAHVVIVGHSTMSENGLELDMPGQSGRRVPAAFNDVWALERKGEARVFTRKKGGVLGSRSLEAVELPGDLSKMWAAMREAE